MNKPLEGLRIISLSQYGAGPYATLQLADLGAEVIKIEQKSTNGDVSRQVIPYAENGDSLFFQSLNRNKKSITLDVKSEKGREIFYELVRESDAVFNNFRGDVPEKLGITYEQLKHINPQIVTCSLSGFGTSGSLRSEPAYDYLLQAKLGHMSLTGEPEGVPSKYGLSIIDFSTGMMAALGLMVGIYQAKSKGIGSDIDVSLYDTAASVMNYIATWHLNRDYEPKRTGYSAHPTLVPSQLFPTKDGNVVVMCNKEKFFQILCERLGKPELAEDGRYKDFENRFKNKETLTPKLISLFKEKDTKYWIDKLKGKVPIAPVNTVKEALEDPFIKEREMIVEYEHPTFGLLKMLGTPIKVKDYKPEYKAGPSMGEHNTDIYQNLLNLTPEEIKALQNDSTI
ncbi:CaiB/BaiF CoA transferase family protein [Virgibacillus litoralis]|uniref:Crotonobetainyl-CoA:carnitine CoA-transferase CaiB-like acyl-CoA transferase n=1 Tax=Virgibacillus litoralis TaxID=578221 RepID=A0ABS4H846_9BACI|nr:CoA transferase [Virgibacillus litoralis]MBP1947085.1 crotonobetainyl-CoA:carnitine CoA-transferase CaiB-like acyl-CoA transferase [Virgibacillus litoralis]